MDCFFSVAYRLSHVSIHTSTQRQRALLRLQNAEEYQTSLTASITFRGLEEIQVAPDKIMNFCNVASRTLSCGIFTDPVSERCWFNKLVWGFNLPCHRCMKCIRYFPLFVHTWFVYRFTHKWHPCSLCSISIYIGRGCAPALWNTVVFISGNLFRYLERRESCVCTHKV